VAALELEAEEVLQVQADTQELLTFRAAQYTCAAAAARKT
jgi:hypothetical protein